MVFIPSRKEDFEYISPLREQTMHELNELVGYQKYKINEEKFKTRFYDYLTNPHLPYKYFTLATDTGEFAGFVNLLFTKNLGEILLARLRSEYETEENMNIMLIQSINLFKSAGIPKVLTEIPFTENLFKKCFQQLQGKIAIYIATLDL